MDSRSTHPQPPDSTRLKIGAVARLTGLSVHTLRKWEERYHAVVPSRTRSGGRLYSSEDVRRLALIRRLTQAGLPLAEAAGKSLGELEAMVGAITTQHSVLGEGSVTRVAVALVGSTVLATAERGGLGNERIELRGTADEAAGLAEALRGREVEVLVLESPTLHRGSAAWVHDVMATCGARWSVVVYGFGADSTLAGLREHGFGLLRAPASVDELELAILRIARQVLTSPSAASGFDEHGAAPAPRFSLSAIRTAAASAPAMRCECPHHLADLLFSLRAFERYSLECESSNPEDAVLHRYLGRVSGHARSTFEEALARVAAAEGIVLQEGLD